MDRAPEITGRVGSRLIAMAVSLVGDAEKVRAEIKCSEADFREYVSGRKHLPQAEIEVLISIVVREQGNLIAQNRELLARMREKQKR